MAGQPGRCRRFFPRQGPTLPLCTGVFSQRGGLVLLPNPAGNGKHKSSHRRKKVGAVFYIPDFMEIQTPRAFPNCPERWRDNSESAEDFSPDKGRLSRYAPAHFCRGAALFSPPNPEWDGNTKLPLLLQKVGVVFIKAKPIDKSGGKKTEKGLGGASCILPQPLRMRKLKCMPPPAFQAAFSFPPVKTSCFIGVQCIY